MIRYHYEYPFQLEGEDKYTEWIIGVFNANGYNVGDIAYVFCSDEYLLRLNQSYLNHDYYTDVITFAFDEDPARADIFISVERVTENADRHKTPMLEEMRRVMVHGVLHLVGFDDKDVEGQREMRAKEEEHLALFHVKQ